MVAAVLLAAAAGSVSYVSPRAAVRDKFYDCRFRRLGHDFAAEVVLAGWPSRARAAAALADVDNGLRLEHAGGTPDVRRCVSAAGSRTG
eukprot:gene19769-15933_t